MQILYYQKEKEHYSK